MKKDITILIPLYNEAESLKELYQKIISIEYLSSKNIEILFIDDGSKDDSLKILKEIYENDKERVRIISFRRNHGKSSALSAGFKYANGDIVITMDADLQDEPNEIPNLINKLNEGYDLVSGWKKKRRDPISKTLPSKIFNKVTAFLTGIKIHDFNCGLKAYKSDVVKEIDVYGELHRYIPVLAHLLGYRISEIPVEHHYRKYGHSKYGLWRFFSGFFDLLTILFLSKYVKRPLHFFGVIGLIFTFIGIAIALYFAIADWLIGTGLRVRPLLLLSLGLILMGIQFFSIGLIGEMITSLSGKTRTGYSIKYNSDSDDEYIKK